MMEQDSNNNKAALDYAIKILKDYANTTNWGITSSYGHKKTNRWIGEGEGVELAEEALRKIELILRDE
ncbi:hypothetical protein NIES267_38850 [Calothrix parasitica NIES-267]|uniref:Uncharacterized protein n=1 Tax=Calothrix parasitica NIES-267 TaxID=1973488 RepID=A0A1Z4LT22_9CYAN|nr:hypothetical protein NIES267_38850 [Calothrix parasitica NIES-267]